MTHAYDYTACRDALRRHTGVVITVYLPAAVEGGAMLRDTVQSFVDAVDDPRAVCLSVDGPDAGGPAEAVAAELGASLVVGDANRGKLIAARTGAAHLIEHMNPAYIALADQDGDHFANELMNLVRAARHVERTTGGDNVMVLGRRISRHRPMGFLRGELEELADRVMLDALHYHAARSGDPLKLEFATTLEEFPDFHSGYKLFTRAAAESALLAPLNLAGCTEECASRHAVESVLTVEAILGGARLASVNRSTIDEQPVSTFGLLDREQLMADKMIWPCRRLDVRARFADQWIRNHAPRLLLNTLAPRGGEEIAAIHRRVVDALDGEADPRPIVRPDFI